MEFPFYSDYIIDDSNIWCGRIIVVGCDNIHRYFDPCDFINDCFRTPEIDRCNMVVDTPTQSAIPGAFPWAILAVNSQWNCLEYVDICTMLADCWFVDEKVLASPDDQTPGTLIQKLVSCDTWVKINIIEIPWIDAKVQLCLDQITPADIDRNFPNCTGTVKFNASWFIFDCDDDSGNWLRGQRYASTDVVINQAANLIKRYLISSLPIAPSTTGFTLAPDVDVYYGNPAMNSGVWAIYITKTAMYKVWCKGNAKINNWVQALRLFVVARPNTKEIVCDAKFGWGGNWPLTPLLPDTRTEWYFEFHADNLVKLNAWDYLFLAARVDSNTAWGVAAQVTRQRSVLWLDSTGTPVIQSNPNPWLTFWVTWYSDSVYSAN